MDKTAEKILDLFRSVDELIFCLFMFSLPLGWSFSIVPLLLLFVVMLVSVFRNFQKPDKVRVMYFLPILAFFLWNLTSLLWSDNRAGGFALLSKQVSLFIISLLFLLIPFSKALVKKGFAFFIAGLIVSFLFCVAEAVGQSLNIEKYSLELLAIAPKSFGILDSSMNANYFMGHKFSIFAHPTYQGTMVFLGLLLIMFSYVEIKHQMLHFSLCALLLINGWMLSTNALYLVLAMLMLYWFVESIVKLNVYRNKRLIAISIALIMIFGLALSPQFKAVLNDNDGRIELKKQTTVASFSAASKSFLFGEGIGSVQHVLNKEYVALGYLNNKALKLNPHNQYLHSLLIGGVISLGLLLWMLGNLITLGIQRENKIPILFSIGIGVIFFFESYLLRYWGIVFFSVIYALFYDGFDKVVASDTIKLKPKKR